MLPLSQPDKIYIHCAQLSVNKNTPSLLICTKNVVDVLGDNLFLSYHCASVSLAYI